MKKITAANICEVEHFATLQRGGIRGGAIFGGNMVFVFLV